jgi:DNA-binding NarL/FixJ family response regulator
VSKGSALPFPQYLNLVNFLVVILVDPTHRHLDARLSQMMNTIRLLIVDDHMTVRDALQVSLGSKPSLEVLACDCDLNSVTDCVNKYAPDVVLFEPKNLNGKGFEACRRIMAARPEPAVIVLTSYSNEQEAMILAELGVRRYLLKDIDTQSLYSEILSSYAENKKHHA